MAASSPIPVTSIVDGSVVKASNTALAWAVVRDHAVSGSPASLSTMQLSGGPAMTVVVTDATPKISASSSPVTSSQTPPAVPPPPPAGASDAGTATDVSALALPSVPASVVATDAGPEVADVPLDAPPHPATRTSAPVAAYRRIPFNIS